MSEYWTKERKAASLAEGVRMRNARALSQSVGVEIRSVHGGGPLCGCGANSALHLRHFGQRRGVFFCTRCVVAGLAPELSQEAAHA